MKHKKKQYRIHKVDNPMGAEGGSEVKNKNELAVNDPMFELEEMDESTSSSTCIEVSELSFHCWFYWLHSHVLSWFKRDSVVNMNYSCKYSVVNMNW